MGGEHASITLNGGDNWWSGGTNTAYSHVNVNLNIPGNRISTVIVISGSSHESGDFRTTMLGFQDNCLRLPSGLEYVDDMDYAQVAGASEWSTGALHGGVVVQQGRCILVVRLPWPVKELKAKKK